MIKILLMLNCLTLFLFNLPQTALAQPRPNWNSLTKKQQEEIIEDRIFILSHPCVTNIKEPGLLEDGRFLKIENSIKFSSPDGISFSYGKEGTSIEYGSCKITPPKVYTNLPRTSQAFSWPPGSGIVISANGTGNYFKVVDKKSSHDFYLEGSAILDSGKLDDEKLQKMKFHVVCTDGLRSSIDSLFNNEKQNDFNILIQFRGLLCSTGFQKIVKSNDDFKQLISDFPGSDKAQPPASIDLNTIDEKWVPKSARLAQ